MQRSSVKEVWQRWWMRSLAEGLSKRSRAVMMDEESNRGMQYGASNRDDESWRGIQYRQSGRDDG
jgi:hypothetical protein